MRIARTLAELDDATARLRQAKGSLALVPTMGALHAGHDALLARARAECGGVAASVFINPTQFDRSADFARYPRDEPGDLATLQEAGCDLAWVPSPAVMYPPGDATSVLVGGPASGWEDEHRPGHFRGMATVVAKLLGQVRPDVAIFGEKDWQQLQIVTRMAADLHLGARILGVPTVREPDGLAMSSRNRFLSPVERLTAPLLHGVLAEAASDLASGDDAARLLAKASARLAQAGLAVDYLALVDGQSLRPLDRRREGARLIAAARLGGVRLLDNVPA